MARVTLEDGARRDLERLVQFLLGNQPAAAEQTRVLVINALRILEHHPFVGRPVEDGLRELVISRGRTGYIALYDYLEADDVVVVLALRHQREAGFPDHG